MRSLIRTMRERGRERDSEWAAMYLGRGSVFFAQERGVEVAFRMG